MRLVLTGGGTGGHIYPALEVGRGCRGDGIADIVYLGSLRGQEGRLATEAGMEFFGFPSQPIYSLKTARGWRAAIAGLRSVVLAKRRLRTLKPDFVFSTGGYSAAPVMAAARSLGIPYGIHEANSVPGRSNRMFAGAACFFSCVFHETVSRFPQAVRTGQPIRASLREAARSKNAEFGETTTPTVLVTGGSQGSAFLNGLCPDAARLLKTSCKWLHASGPSHYEAVKQNAALGERYRIEPYLDAEAMAHAYRSATVAVGRGGGTLAEYALFRLPSVLVPLPSSADDHQLHNAEEFEKISAANVLRQASATPQHLADLLDRWFEDDLRRSQAAENLAGWDVPDATERIVALIRANMR